MLNNLDIHSETWVKVKAELESQLIERREYNDGKTLSEVETAFIRGQIDHIKRMLKMGEEPRK